MNSFGVKKSQGFGLVEVLVVLGIFSIIAFGVAALMSSTMNQASSLRMANTKSNLAFLVSRYSADPRALRATSIAAVNNTTRLINCVFGISPPPPSPPGAPSQCVNGGAGVGFSLLDGSGTAISGPPATPARFDIEGRPCAAASRLCVFEVSTTFTADCGTFPSPCTSAQNITVNYTVRHPATVGFQTMSGLALAPVTGTTTTAVATILSNLSNNYVPMMNGGTTSLTNSIIFQNVDPLSGETRVGIGTNNPSAKVDIAGGLAFTFSGKKFRSVVTNGGIKSRVPAGSYGEDTALFDTCDGQWQLYQCPMGGGFTPSCRDTVAPCGDNGCGGNYYIVTCNAGLMWVEQP